MPDFDQKRSVLPNDGKMYCVPTSYVDLYKYMAEHGMPSMDSIYSNSYNDISGFILFTGILMGTDAVHGTHGAFEPGSSWINLHTSKLVYQWGYGPDWDWGVNTLRNALLSGSLCAIGRGKYEWDGNDYDRVGGHEVVLTGFNYNGSNRVLIVRDPNDDANLTTQSAYASVNKATENYTIDTEDYGVVTHARYTMSTGDTGNRRYVVDSLHQVMPVFAGWPSGTSAGTTFNVHWPWMWEELTHGNTQTMTFTTPNTVTDWCFDIGEVAIYYTMSNGQVHRIDMVDQTDTVIAVIAGANKIVVGGPTCDIYVLKKVIFSAGDSIVRIERSDNSLLTRALPKHIHDIDWDVKGDGLAMISTDFSAMYRYDADLTSLKTDGILQVSAIPPLFSAVVDYGIDHISGEMILATEGMTTYQRYRRSNGRWVGRNVSYRGTTGIQAIAPGEQGLTFIQDGGALWTTDSNGNYVNTDFSGLSVSGDFQLSRSYVATRPGSMDGPSWDNAEPDE